MSSQNERLNYWLPVLGMTSVICLIIIYGIAIWVMVTK